jgi:polar amino acid transport system substrate-binding protein
MDAREETVIVVGRTLSTRRRGRCEALWWIGALSQPRHFTVMFLLSVLSAWIAASAFAQDTAPKSAMLTPDPKIIALLAPTGTLRAGLYVGTPTSALVDGEQRRGVGFELGRALAAALGVAYEPKIFPKNADVLAAIKSGAVDVAFTNASAERARVMDFGPPYLGVELGYLTLASSPIQSIADIDVIGRRVGVTRASSSEAALPKILKAATVTPVADFEAGVRALRAGELDAYATNKASLFEMAKALPNARVLAESWSLERHAVAIPQGRTEALAFVRAFTANAVSSGLVAAAMERAGLQGAQVLVISP